MNDQMQRLPWCEKRNTCGGTHTNRCMQTSAEPRTPSSGLCPWSRCVAPQPAACYSLTHPATVLSGQSYYGPGVPLLSLHEYLTPPYLLALTTTWPLEGTGRCPSLQCVTVRDLMTLTGLQFLIESSFPSKTQWAQLLLFTFLSIFWSFQLPPESLIGFWLYLYRLCLAWYSKLFSVSLINQLQMHAA